MLATRIKPVSYLKANAAEVIQDLSECQEPLIITQNGEAKMVVQDVHSYERDQQAMAMLKIIAMGRQQVLDGKTRPAKDAFDAIREMEL